MITVKFEKHDQSYKRTIGLPDGGQLIEHGVVIPPQWHLPETWSWVKPLHEYTRDQLAREGRAVAQALLGQKGRDYIKNNSPGSTRLVVFETRDLPEIARVPWEIACIDNEFIITDRFIPLVRQPEHVQTQKKLSIHRPLRMVLISAAPADQPTLMIEEEMLSIPGKDRAIHWPVFWCSLLAWPMTWGFSNIERYWMITKPFPPHWKNFAPSAGTWKAGTRERCC
jgi:hypothetical protein